MTKESAKHLKKQGEQKTKRRELETQLEKLGAENAALAAVAIALAVALALKL